MEILKRMWYTLNFYCNPATNDDWDDIKSYLLTKL